MIRNDNEYREAKERLADFQAQIEAIREDLRKTGADDDTIARATEPNEVLVEELSFDVRLFERLRSEGISAVPSFSASERGKALIALRIARGWTQRQLAEALGVSETQVSRDERNDYHGITQDRFARILDVLGVEETSHYQQPALVSVEMPLIELEAASSLGEPPDLIVEGS